MREHLTGEIWIDRIEGLQVMTVNDSGKIGCKACAFSTSAGGATGIPAVPLTVKMAMKSTTS